MRLGIFPPWTDSHGTFLDAKGLAAQAALIEAAGFDGIWMGEHLPLLGEGKSDYPDLLMYLLTCAAGTEHVELGTCIYTLPLRNKFEAARDFYTLETLFPERFTFGIGVGSQPAAYAAAGLEWENRFARLGEHMAAVRALFANEPPEDAAFEGERVPSWGSIVGRPRFFLGAWHSEAQLRRAVTEYDGWMASAGHGTRVLGWKKVLTEGIKRYRDLGGGRAILATTGIDLSQPDAPLADDAEFTLICGPEAAAERLHLVEELGFDDVLLLPANYSRTERLSLPIYLRHPEYTMEELQQIRALMPRDTRDYRLPRG